MLEVNVDRLVRQLANEIPVPVSLHHLACIVDAREHRTAEHRVHRVRLEQEAGDNAKVAAGSRTCGSNEQKTTQTARPE